MYTDWTAVILLLFTAVPSGHRGGGYRVLHLAAKDEALSTSAGTVTGS